LLAIALLTAAVLVLYSSLHRAGFINLDDPVYVARNSRVLTGLTPDNVRWAWTATVAANWHPLTMLSLQLDSQLFGQQAWAYHRTNLVLHLANTLLLFTLLRRLTGAVWRSAIVAALFGIHPLHVESVAWIAERKDVLSTFFGLLALLAYAGYARAPGVGRYALVFVCLALSLLAKPMLVTLPALLLLLDYWPLRRWRLAGADASADTQLAAPQRSAAWLVLEKVPLLLLVAASCVVTLWAQRSAVRSLDLISLPQRLGNALASCAAYLRQMLVPLDLAPYYPHPGANLAAADVALGSLLLVGVTVLVLALGRRYAYLPVGWFWYLGTLVPVIGLVQVADQARADRYTYVPLVGIFLMLTWGLSDLARHWHYERAAAVLAGVVLAALMAAGWVQVGYWEEDALLWQHTFEVTERSAVTHNQLALALREKGDLQGAWKHFDEAVKLAEDKPHLHSNLGLILLMLGNPSSAAEHLQKAMDLDPNPPTALYYNLALALANLGRAEHEAVRSERMAGRSQQAAQLSERAAAHLKQAAEQCREALKRDPGMVPAQELLRSLSGDKGSGNQPAHP
jgi:tetratricopeptide (TPR) repeat protein